MERHQRYGKIFKETICGRTIVHLFDPDFIRTMYALEGRHPHTVPLLEVNQMYRKVAGMAPGLGNSNGDEWYKLRNAVQPEMMRPQSAAMYLPNVNDVLDDFLERLAKIRDPSTGLVHNFNNELLKWNLECAGVTCFETRLGCLECSPDSPQQRMIDANRDIFRLALKLRFSLPWFRLFPTPTWKALVEKEDVLWGKGQKLIDETVCHIKRLTEEGTLRERQYKFLTYLMNQDLSYKDLSIVTLALFIDGLSATSPIALCQLYCLARNEAKQNELREKILDVAPDLENPVTPEVFNRLPYLKACVKEGFRFFPVGTEVTRVPQNNVVIGGYQIPAGTNVQLNNNMLLKNPEYFTDPDDYTPERWMRDCSKEIIHPYLLLPFSFGPRNCVGKRFAEQQIYCLLIKFLQRYHIRWPHIERLGQRYNMLLTPSLNKPFNLTPI